MQKLSVCMANGEKLMPSDYLRIKRDVLKLGAIVDKYRDPIGEYEMEFKRRTMCSTPCPAPMRVSLLP